ncbi:MAG: DUF166 family protein [Methanomicrobiales archaeon]
MRQLTTVRQHRDQRSGSLPEMQINIISDGLFGKRAFENINRQFPCRWVTVPYSASAVMENIEIDLPPSDLSISYARQPDVILAIAEQGEPVILGITPGPGLFRQAKEINPLVFSAPTMCSLEPKTGCKEIDLYAEKFGHVRQLLANLPEECVTNSGLGPIRDEMGRILKQFRKKQSEMV